MSDPAAAAEPADPAREHTPAAAEAAPTPEPGEPNATDAPQPAEPEPGTPQPEAAPSGDAEDGKAEEADAEDGDAEDGDADAEAAPPGEAEDEDGDAQPVAAPSGEAEDGNAGPEAAPSGEAGSGDGGPGAEPPVSGRGGVGESPAGPTTGDADAETDSTDAEAEAEAADGTGAHAAAGRAAEAVPQLSEAAAELAAQKIERERIARRKAEREAPVEAGAKLSGTAADLLAAVRAVESGGKPPARFDAPPAPRRPEPAKAPAPARTPAPAPQTQTQAQAQAQATAPSPDAVQAIRAVLARGGAPEALAPQAAAALGEDAAAQLAESPWRLLAVAGVRPTQADGFARALLGAETTGPGDERRAAALVGWLLAQAAAKGHTVLEAPTLESALAQYGVPDPAEALEAAVGEGAALAFEEPVGPPVAEDEEQPPGAPPGGAWGRVLVGLEGSAMAEESLAEGLARLANTFTDPADWDKAATGPGAELIRAAAGHGLVTHTGGEAARAEPRALLTAAREFGLRAVLAAHAPAEDAVTVAGLLAGAEGPGRDADGQFALDLLIVLDAPQLDVETAAALVESVPDGARLVLSGDPAVLGSAGPGRVFGDVLAARACPQLVSRIPDPGPIGELVSGIGVGELYQVDAPGKEVVIVPVRDAGEAVHRTVQLVAESVPRAFGIPADAVQVITPGHGGPAGTRALNAALKERLNPGPGRFGGFDPGDRVVHVPSAGRALPARVVSADAQGLHLAGAAGARIVVPKERVESQVRHGWAVTAHQAVGSRWPAAVVVLPGDAAQALSRDWVYTAFGRAERHLSVVHGVDQALPRAVAEVPAKPRMTRLTGLLRALVQSASAQSE
ncbi:helix-hairpin-helix domain-containing protein [Streptomyces sp. NBC_01264]|uniref:helix-hairpin-helix domain-containing protein n=1 Tax=Streptomyces sp. NBC_01264 TaxID=2903804 RepID=UPI0022507FFD|nr:helix-hairpin-helix domain-containing protein [Streptomyces sp. NBC_01264]MCX4777344.1 ATP-binding domain-containing protein [Streptomyces sp. NBC_01264]